MGGSKSVVAHLLRRLEAAWRGSRWHSFQGALEGLTEEEALWVPPYYKGFPWSRGSIREIVFHVGGDDLIQMDRAFGEGGLSWEALTQRYQTDGENWPAALELAQSGHARVRAALEGLTDADLQRRIRSYSGEMTVEDLFGMLIEHKLYHAGQIRYIRCLLEGMDQPA